MKYSVILLLFLQKEVITFPLIEVKSLLKKEASDHPQVGVNNYEFSYDQAMNDAQSTYMSSDDIDAFNLINAFASQSLLFTDNQQINANDKTMDLKQYELQFAGTRDQIISALDQIVGLVEQETNMLEAAGHPMKLSVWMWRVLQPISHVFVDVPQHFINTKQINKVLLEFIAKQAWPLKKLTVEWLDGHSNELKPDFQKFLELYKPSRPDYNLIGKQVALICNKIIQIKKAKGEVYNDVDLI